MKLQFRAAREPRKILMRIYGGISGLAPFLAGLSISAGQPVVRSAVYAAVGVAFFFLFRAEQEQRKAEHRLAVLAGEARAFAAKQRKDITHGEAMAEMVEFIKQQKRELEK